MGFQLPVSKLNIKENANQKFVFDPIRKKWLVLTPEEFIRQQWLDYLITAKKYPSKLLSVEKQFSINTLNKRADIIVYNRKGKPVMIIECKSADIKISQQTIDQAGLYNLNFKVDWLVVSNGIQTYILKLNLSDGLFQEMIEIPDFSSL